MSKKRNLTAPYEFVGCEASHSTRDIIDATASKFMEIDEKYHASLYNCLAVAYEVVSRLETHDEWEAFVADPFWKTRPKRYRPKLGVHEDSIVGFVALRIFAGFNYERYDRAWKYGRIIDYYYCRGIEARDFATQIKGDGGIEKALKAAIQFDPRRIHDMPSKALAKHRANLASDKAFYEGAGAKSKGKPKSEVEDDTATVTEPNQYPAFGLQVDGTYMVGVRVRADYYNALMRCSVGDIANMRIKRIANDDEWVDLKAIRLRL